VDFKTFEKDSYLEKAIHDEIRILNKFKHPNIVQLHEVLNSKRSLYIIMDFCRDGDLKKYLRNKKKVNEEEAFEIMKQVLKGYQELARNNTIHRDLKPANILINGGLFKICDFGFSKVIKDPNTALKTCVGSPIYMAPQILEKKDYSAKCDIWSLGIIYY
jgi:serine/threonine-protein kinase ULK/ATG1